MTLALVTGTSSGIGLHTAIELAKTGVSIVATVRDTSRADALRSAASAAEVELDIRALEVTDAAAAEALIEAVGPVDILVNNAGRGAVGTLEQLSDADLQAQLDRRHGARRRRLAVGRAQAEAPGAGGRPGQAGRLELDPLLR